MRPETPDHPDRLACPVNNRIKRHTRADKPTLCASCAPKTEELSVRTVISTSCTHPPQSLQVKASSWMQMGFTFASQGAGPYRQEGPAGESILRDPSLSFTRGCRRGA